MKYPAGPEGTTTYLVGDIHGRDDLLAQLLARIDADKSRRDAGEVTEIYLGDYIDRGPDSAAVVARLLARTAETKTVFLRGNHEQMLLDFLQGEDCLPVWAAVGAFPTLMSYGVPPRLLARAVQADAVRESFLRQLPPDHREFYERTALHARFGRYLAVHAGLKPGVPLEAQSEADLISIRRAFLNHDGDFGCIVVHGHTPVKEPELLHNRINIDTGAFATNRLTCLRVGADGAHILSHDGQPASAVAHSSS